MSPETKERLDKMNLVELLKEAMRLNIGIAKCSNAPEAVSVFSHAQNYCLYKALDILNSTENESLRK